MDGYFQIITHSTGRMNLKGYFPVMPTVHGGFLCSGYRLLIMKRDAIWSFGWSGEELFRRIGEGRNQGSDVD